MAFFHKCAPSILEAAAVGVVVVVVVVFEAISTTKTKEEGWRSVVGGGLDVLPLLPRRPPDHMSSLLLTWGAAASAAGCRFHMVLHGGRGRPSLRIACRQCGPAHR